MEKQKTGEFLKQARLRKNWTQKQLATLVCVSDKAVSRWETGNSFPDVDLLLPLATALCVNVTDILLGQSTAPDAECSTVLKDVLGEVQTQQVRLKRRLQSALTGLLLVIIALVIGIFTALICAFYLIEAEPNMEEARLTLAWLFFCCLIIFITIFLPVLLLCLAWRVRVSTRSKMIWFLCTATMVGTALWFVFYWGHVWFSNR